MISDISLQTEFKPPPPSQQVQKALVEVLKQLGRYDLPDSKWTNAMSSATKLTGADITAMCTNMYEGSNNYGPPSVDTYAAMGAGYAGNYEKGANEPKPAKDFLKCPTPLAYGTTPLAEEQGYYRCFEAKAMFQYQCENMLGFLNDQMTIPEGATGPYGSWRSPWDADWVRRALQFELDPHHEQEW